MTATLIDVFEASYGGDMSKGETIGYASTRKDAEILAKGKGYWAGDGEVNQRKAIRFADGATYILASSTPVDLDGKNAQAKAELRKQALSKLSPEELAVLEVK